MNIKRFLCIGWLISVTSFIVYVLYQGRNDPMIQFIIALPELTFGFVLTFSSLLYLFDDTL